jgi:glucose/arabinose dehydrogenase
MKFPGVDPAAQPAHDRQNTAMRRLLGRSVRPIFAIAAASLLTSCYVMRPSSGSGQTAAENSRTPSAADIVVPAGYQAELVSSGLNFPVGTTFDDQGRVYVVESGYSYGEVFAEPRLLRIDGGQATPIASGGRGGPWTGVTFYRDRFYVADGNVLEGGRLLRIGMDGKIETLVSGLPSLGDHHTNGPIVGPDGWIYFAQGTATNSGVVGEDNLKFGWLKRHPEFHDIPGQDVTLTGENYESPDLLGQSGGRKTSTGAFLPFGTTSQPGQVIKGAVKCSGAILRVRPEGGEPELVAWGFRNPFGLAFAPDGALYTTENGYDDRGSRKVWGAPDVLWRVETGKWYGWPDYVAGMPITDERFASPGNRRLKFVLATHPNAIPPTAARFAVHSSADGFDFSRQARFGFAGEAFVAIFGDQAPTTGKILGPVGGKVVRVDPRTGVISDFAVNRAPREGAASKVGGAGLERPVAARFDPSGESLYVVDFGVMQMDQQGSHPRQNTGVLWRIRRTAP